MMSLNSYWIEIQINKFVKLRLFQILRFYNIALHKIDLGQNVLFIIIFVSFQLLFIVCAGSWVHRYIFYGVSFENKRIRTRRDIIIFTSLFTKFTSFFFFHTKQNILCYSYVLCVYIGFLKRHKYINKIVVIRWWFFYFEFLFRKTTEISTIKPSSRYA